MSLCRVCRSAKSAHLCGACARAKYCSKACAAEDWKMNHAYECIGLEGNDDLVGLQSADGFKIEIRRADAMRMLTLQNLIEDAGLEDYIPLPIIDGETLRRIATFIKDKQLVELDNDEYVKLLKAANYLDYTDLLMYLLEQITQRYKFIDPRGLKDVLRLGLFFFRGSIVYLKDFVKRFNIETDYIDFVLKLEDPDAINWGIAYAASIGDGQLMRMLLKRDYGSLNEALLIAVQKNRAPIVEMLLRDARIYLDRLIGWNIVDAAIKLNSAEIVMLLKNDERFNYFFKKRKI